MDYEIKTKREKQKQNHRDYNKEYRLKNKEKIKRDAAEWYQRNKERLIKEKRERRKKQKTSKTYYELNKEKILKRCKESYAIDKAEASKKQRQRDAGLKAAATRKANKEDILQQIKQEREEQRYKTPEKDEQRDIMFKLLSEICEYGNGYNNILYLESPDMTFTKMIYGDKYQKDKIGSKYVFSHIPNNIEYMKFPKEPNKTKVAGGGNVINIYNKSLNAYLTNTTKKFRFIWADYCGTFNKYKGDIDKVFDMDHLESGESIYAVTFCSRGDQTINETDLKEKDLIRVVEEYVYNAAERNGYFIRPLKDSGRYKRNMYTCIFKVTKNKTNRKTTEERVADNLITVSVALQRHEKKISELTNLLTKVMENQNNDVKVSYAPYEKKGLLDRILNK